MQQDITELEINGIKYIRKDCQQTTASVDGLTAVIVSAGQGGIHFGFLENREGQEVTLLNARRIKYWNGAASITELAARGTSKPTECQFSTSVNRIILPLAVEILEISTKALQILQSVPVWSK